MLTRAFAGQTSQILIGVKRRLHSQSDKPDSEKLNFLCFATRTNETAYVSGDVNSIFLSREIET